MRKIREDKFDKVILKCIICGNIIFRAKYLEESRIQQNKLGPVCSSKCSGKLGWQIKKSSKRESSRIERD